MRRSKFIDVIMTTNKADLGKLPIDLTLRPPHFHIAGVTTNPTGWILRVPPRIFQFYKKTGYIVVARHELGEQFILLDWCLNSPSWNQFQLCIPTLPPADWYNQEVIAQVEFSFSLFYFLFIYFIFQLKFLYKFY
jgi:hypothetical protein